MRAARRGCRQPVGDQALTGRQTRRQCHTFTSRRPQETRVTLAKIAHIQVDPEMIGLR